MAPQMSPSPATINPAYLLSPKASKASKASRVPNASASAARPAQLDAVALLNPRASKDSKPGTKLPQKDEQEPTEIQGLGSRLEQLHKVEKRSEQPRSKKMKRSHSEFDDGDYKNDQVEVQQKAEFKGGIGNGGEMGGYIKEQRQKLNDDAVTANGYVDLTLGDSDDEEDMVIANNPGDTEVCLGRIENAKVQAYKVPSPKTTTSLSFGANAKHWVSRLSGAFIAYYS